MTNTVVAFNASHAVSVSIARDRNFCVPVPVQYWYQYLYWYMPHVRPQRHAAVDDHKIDRAYARGEPARADAAVLKTRGRR
jgi:hypothetical protein